MTRPFFGLLALLLLGAGGLFAQPSPTTPGSSNEAAVKTRAILGPPIVAAPAGPPMNLAAYLGAPTTPTGEDPPVKILPSPAAIPSAPPAICDDSWTARNASPATRFWVGADYLLWKVTSAPVRVPLVTGNNNPAAIGSLNEPGTTVLFGQNSGQSTNFGLFSGGRVSFGGWFDQGQRVGFEASGFLLENRSILFNASSAGGTAAIVSIPFDAAQPFNNNPAGPANVFTNPAGPTSLNAGNAPNSVTARLNSRLWGAEGNGVANIYNSDRFHLTGLFGFRYLDLYETLSLTDVFADTASNGVLAVSDGFGARNQFYGGQLGAKAGMSLGRWNFDAGLKVALGSNHENLNVGGNTAVTNGAFGFNSGITPGGVFAQTTNIGSYDRSVFAVVPEAQVKIGFAITPRIDSFVGFNYLFLSSALRPGNQVDSATQTAFFVPPGTGGAPAPTTLHSSSFSAYGVNFGLAFKF